PPVRRRRPGRLRQRSLPGLLHGGHHADAQPPDQRRPVDLLQELRPPPLHGRARRGRIDAEASEGGALNGGPPPVPNLLAGGGRGSSSLDTTSLPHRSHTFLPSRKHETMPSSLILRTGPNRLATRAAVVRAPSTRGEGDDGSGPARARASWRRMA